MKRIKNILGFAIFSIFLMTIASAAMTVNITDPVASSMITGAAVFFNVTSGDANVSWNCTVYAQSATSANSSWVTLIDGTTTANESETGWNITIDTTMIQDANDYILNATCSNGSDTADDTNIGISIDNGDPTASWGSSSIADGSYILNMDSITLASGTDADIGLSSCTFTLNGETEDITASSDACSASKNLRDAFGVTSAGTYTYNFLVTDHNANTTTVSTSRTLYVKITPGGGGGGTSGDEADPALIQQTFLDQGGSTPSGQNWFVRAIDSVLGFFKRLFS